MPGVCILDICDVGCKIPLMGMEGKRKTRPMESSIPSKQIGPYVPDNSARTYRTTRPVDTIILNVCQVLYIIFCSDFIIFIE